MSEPWMDDALCAQTDPEAFFPENGGSAGAAKKICGQCDVRAECLEYALVNRIPEGVWGGKAARKRRNLLSAGVAPTVRYVAPRQAVWADVVSAYGAGVRVAVIAERFQITERSVYRIVSLSRDAA